MSLSATDTKQARLGQMTLLYAKGVGAGWGDANPALDSPIVVTLLLLPAIWCSWPFGPNEPTESPPPPRPFQKSRLIVRGLPHRKSKTPLTSQLGVTAAGKATS